MSVNLGSAYGSITIDTAGVSQNVKVAIDLMGQAESSFLGIAGPVAVAQGAMQLFTEVVQGVGQAVESLGEGLIGGNKEFEQYEVGFKVLLGNAELAQQRMQDLADFNQKTPFELPGVVESDRILQGFGLHAAAVTEHFRKMDIDVRAVTADVAAGAKTDMQRIATDIGRFSAGATGEAIEDFQRMGVLTREELKGMGVEFNKSGQLVSPLPEAMDVVLTILKEKYGGMADEQSKTLGGMESNLADWKDNTLRMLGEPIFDKVKDGVQLLLDVLNSEEAKSATTEFAESINLVIQVLGDFLGLPSRGDLQGFVKSFAEGLQTVNSFLTEFHDRLRGFTGQDVMGELSNNIDAVNDRLGQSLDDLEKNYDRTVKNIQGNIQVANDDFNAAMAEVAEKYGKKAEKVEEQTATAIKNIRRQMDDATYNYEESITKKRQALQEKLGEMADQWAEKQRSINQSIQDQISGLEDKRADIQEKLQEKLDSLSDQHGEKRAKLEEQLAAASTQEERDKIQTLLAAEDGRYESEVKKAEDKAKKEEQQAKDKADKAINRLKEQLAREEAEYNKKVDKEKAREAQAEADETEKYNRQMANYQARIDDENVKRQKQLGEIAADRQKDEAEIKAGYDRQMAMLNDKLAAEEQAYADNQAKIKANAQKEIEDMQAQAQARVEALSQPATGAMAQILGFIDTLKQAKQSVDEFSASVDTFFAKLSSGDISGAFKGLEQLDIFGGLDTSEEGVAAKLNPLIDSITNYFQTRWPELFANANLSGDEFWKWTDGAVLQAGEKLNQLLDSIQAWANDPQSAVRLTEMGKQLGAALVDALKLAGENTEKMNEFILIVLVTLGQAIIEASAAITDVGAKIGSGIIQGIIEKITGEKVSKELAATIQGVLDAVLIALNPLAQIQQTISSAQNTAQASPGGGGPSALGIAATVLSAGVIPASLIPGHASGADFIVPAQYTNDSYLMRADAGEHVQITPPGMALAGAGGVTMMGNITITIPGAGAPVDVARAVRAELENLFSQARRK
jgi:colicin import membrane protein